MKYYVGHLHLLAGSIGFERFYAIAANELRQAQALLDEARQSHLQEFPQDYPMGNGELREVSPITFQEMSAVIPVLGEDKFSMESLEQDERAKALAHRIQGHLKRHSVKVTLSHMLHAVAASLGETDWHVLLSKAAPQETSDVADSGDPVQLYQGANEPAPPSQVEWPIDPKYWAQFVEPEDSSKSLVTFTAMVPLAVVMEGKQGVISYCEEAFDRKVCLDSVELRVVGNALENYEFDQEFCGDLQLQLTCGLTWESEESEQEVRAMLEYTDPAVQEEVFKHYVVCALGCSTGDDQEPLDASFEIDDLAEETAKKMRDDCARFLEGAARELRESGLGLGQIGHDFWLTRNRHGAGFWDRGIGNVGKTLSDYAQRFAGCDLYVGDDGKLYLA